MRAYFRQPIWLFLICVPAESWAQTYTLPEIEVVAPVDSPGTLDSASQGEVTKERLDERPAYRPGELLETMPGLIVTQHSGEGKANQYFLRGFNLDHGTDLEITVDDMPVNMRTHGHGQGYSDLNFMIPELISGLTYRKGPYYAEEGDFSSAGAIHIGYLDRLDHDIAEVGGGSFNYGRGFAASSTTVGAGTLLTAAEIYHNDGPWQVPDDYLKFNGVVRYSEGTADNGLSLTSMAYSGDWNATNQIAKRAVEEGLIDRFGSLNPTDGGNADRYSLSGRWSERNGDQASKVNAYLIRSDLALFNDFTYFLRDPINGDQFEQTDARTIIGANASHSFFGTFAGSDAETEFGVQTRYDGIHVGLFDTVRRMILSTVRDDHVQESSIGFYGQENLRWSDTFRSIFGLRGDLFHGNDDSGNPLNSGNTTAFIAGPKLSLIFGPFNKTEYYVNAGTGFHSNDVRGATITVDPTDGVTPEERVPLLVRSKGAEVGARTWVIPGLESSLSFFVLDFDSELVFSGDAGTTEAGRPSERIGVEFANLYRPYSWLSFDLDAAYTRARFTNSDPVGNHIPGAVEGVLETGADIDNIGDWFGGLRLRYFGPRPLIEDDSMRSRPTTLVSGDVGYKITKMIQVRLEGFNLLDTKASQIDYYYTSRLPGEPAAGVNDIHFHPVEPRSFRVNLAMKF